MTFNSWIKEVATGFTETFSCFISPESIGTGIALISLIILGVIAAFGILIGIICILKGVI